MARYFIYKLIVIALLQLLELPQFADIIKIKTIGSTYMAASGLNPSMQVKVSAI